MLGTNVMAVIKGCVGTTVSLQEKALSSLPLFLCVCEWHCLCFTYLWQMLAEWNWIPGNEGERSRRASFLCLGTGFLLAGLDPLIVCPAMLLVDNDKGRGWNRLFLSHWAKEPLLAWCFESGNTSNWQNGNDANNKPLMHSTWQIIWSSSGGNTNQLSYSFIQY